MKTYLETNPQDGERGAISLKALFGLVIATVALFTLVKFVPVYVEQQQVKHEVDELARMAAVRGWNEDKIALEFKRLRTDYDLPDGSINFVSQNRHVQVVVGYKRDIDLLVTSYIWHVDYTTTGKEI
jgi:uncharacterized protein DUF4320